MRILVVTSVPAEAEAIGSPGGVTVIIGGVGRTNAAAATTEAIVRGAADTGGAFSAVLNAGVAGALPEGALALGEAVAATSCVYAEEGLIAPDGFLDMAGLGFSLGDFEGNAVPVDGRLLEVLEPRFRTGPIATVATCSGTDAAARAVVHVHAARRLGVGAIELRVVSNTTGDRDRQQWDMPGALKALGPAVRSALDAVRQG
jgi:futalosine hydrolase